MDVACSAWATAARALESVVSQPLASMVISMGLAAASLASPDSSVSSVLSVPEVVSLVPSKALRTEESIFNARLMVNKGTSQWRVRRCRFADVDVDVDVDG